MPRTPEAVRRAAQADGADTDVRANPERLIGWYRQRLADEQHRAAILEVALAEAREEAAATRETVEALTARIDELEQPDEDGSITTDDALEGAERVGEAIRREGIRVGPDDEGSGDPDDLDVEIEVEPADVPDDELVEE